MRYAPEKVFILENGDYIEITYEELQRLMTQEGIDKRRYLVLLQGMLQSFSKKKGLIL